MVWGLVCFSAEFVKGSWGEETRKELGARLRAFLGTLTRNVNVFVVIGSF